MALLVPNIGEVEMLKRILNDGEDLVLHLFQEDHTPAEGDFITSYQEVVAAGYGEEVLAQEWMIAGDPTEATYNQVTFSFNGSATVYGYYVSDLAGNILFWSERFSDGPYNIPSGGGSVKITPKIQLD